MVTHPGYKYSSDSGPVIIVVSSHWTPSEVTDHLLQGSKKPCGEARGRNCVALPPRRLLAPSSLTRSDTLLFPCVVVTYKPLYSDFAKHREIAT